MIRAKLKSGISSSYIKVRISNRRYAVVGQRYDIYPDEYADIFAKVDAVEVEGLEKKPKVKPVAPKVEPVEEEAPAPKKKSLFRKLEE